MVLDIFLLNYSCFYVQPYLGSLQYSKMQASPFNVIQSIVPPRLTLALKGVAFNEYLSALRHISRSEAFRISQGVEPTKRRRYIYEANSVLFSFHPLERLIN